MWVVVVVVVAPILSLCVQENGEWGVKRGDRAVFPPSPLKIFPFKNIFQDLHFRRWTADRVGQVAPSVPTLLFPQIFFCQRKLFLLNKFENWLDHHLPHRNPPTSFVLSPSLILICVENQVHLQVCTQNVIITQWCTHICGLGSTTLLEPLSANIRHKSSPACSFAFFQQSAHKAQLALLTPENLLFFSLWCTSAQFDNDSNFYYYSKKKPKKCTKSTSVTQIFFATYQH